MELEKESISFSIALIKRTLKPKSTPKLLPTPAGKPRSKQTPMPITKPITMLAGNPLLCTIAMPADANPDGDIFGGWIMSQMDISSGVLAAHVAKGRVVTVAVGCHDLSQTSVCG